jgi:glycosyltransferase involved in cell wall biosynthesis
MKTKPSFSICIPTHNGADTISYALESAVNQTLTDHEIIVCDNASTDHTEEIIRSYLPFGIRYFRNYNNIGMANNWNKCIELSNNDWIYLLHDDDRAEHNLLELYSVMIQKYPDVGMIFSRTEIFEGDSKSIIQNLPFSGTRIFNPGELLNYLVDGNFIYTPSVVFRRNIYNTWHFENNFVCDYWMWLRIASKYSVLFIDSLYSHYYHQNKSESNLNLARMMIDTLAVLEDISKDPGYQSLKPKIQINRMKVIFNLSAYYLYMGDIIMGQNYYHMYRNFPSQRIHIAPFLRRARVGFGFFIMRYFPTIAKMMLHLYHDTKILIKYMSDNHQ